MRQVKVFQWVKPEVVGGKFVKAEKCYAAFHQFTTDYEELQSGVGQFPAAIVEYADGTIESVPVSLIQFVK